MLLGMAHTLEGSRIDSPAAPVRARRWPMWLAVGLAVAAWTVLVALLGAAVRGPQPPQAAPAAPTPTVSAPVSPQAADRQLCEAIGPLMQESVTIGKQFVALGHTGSPARDNGIAGFRGAVGNWQARIQPVLDADPGPPRFLHRATQRYIDDLVLYAVNIGPGEATDTDDLAWNDGTVALGAAVAVCGDAGVRWWTG